MDKPELIIGLKCPQCGNEDTSGCGFHGETDSYMVWCSDGHMSIVHENRKVATFSIALGRIQLHPDTKTTQDISFEEYHKHGLRPDRH